MWVKIKNLNSLQKIELLQNKGPDERAEKASTYNDRNSTVKEYGNIIRSSQKKWILSVLICHGKIFKSFIDSERFKERVTELVVSKYTVYFKIKILKILEKYEELKASSLSVNLIKSYLKTV